MQGQKQKPLAVDPATEQMVAQMMRQFAQAQQAALAAGQPAPKDEYGYISPYRAQAMARVKLNTIQPGDPWYGAFDLYRSPDAVDADRPQYEVGRAYKRKAQAREDTDRARVNAYALMRAFKSARQK